MNELFTQESKDGLLPFLKELSEIKDLLREMSQQVLRIERRVRAVLPEPLREKLSVGRRPPSRLRPQMTEELAQQSIAQLKGKLSRGEQIEGELRGYSVKPELQAIAKALGMTNVKLPPKDELVRRISTRLRQGEMVRAGCMTKITVVDA